MLECTTGWEKLDRIISSDRPEAIGNWSSKEPLKGRNAQYGRGEGKESREPSLREWRPGSFPQASREVCWYVTHR